MISTIHVASLTECAQQANEEKRESQKHVRDDLRQIKMLEKEVKKRKASEEKFQEANQELRTKMEVQSKLLHVQSQRMGELEKTARAAEEMVTAWKKHSEVIEMERDEALAQAAIEASSFSTCFVAFSRFRESNPLLELTSDLPRSGG